MKYMNVAEFAKKLNGREYLSEITKAEEKQAKELGFVVVFGYSDDTTEFRGAINDEISSFEGAEIFINKDGILEYCEEECIHYVRAKAESKSIKAIWNKEGYSWIYSTFIKHSTFDILEDGEKYCKGIVFNLKDIQH